ncbi:rhamnan synthesis F family protein [Francisella philomiragia]|uniref:rhamnan synthesis F family protein n=1 Tax=Francisella philomiragia TaxID=28110 RepID=UPI003514889D
MLLKKVILKILPINTRRRKCVSKFYHKFIKKNKAIDITAQFQSGKKKYDPSKETIIIVSHVSSATGAPLLGLNIGKSMSHYFNVIHYIMLKSDIHASFFDDSFLVVEEIYNRSDLSIQMMNELNLSYNIKTVLCNSIVTYPILSIARDLKIPTLSLIHEFTGYVVPASVMRDTLVAADRVVIPAKIIEKSILDYLRTQEVISTKPNNILIQPQGKLPYIPQTYGESDNKYQVLDKIGVHDSQNCKIIVGAGSIDIRKGVDLFISLARYIKKYYKGKCKFVWVGDGLKNNDYAYSFWLEREIALYELEEDFVFLKHQQSLDVVFSVADMYCLTSRMDPFPNIGIDALEADLPIACFGDATGTVEFLEKYKANYIVADYLDTHHLGLKVAKYLSEKAVSTNVNSSLVKDYLSFDRYIDFLLNVIDQCVTDNKQSLKILELLESSEDYDPKYIGLSDQKSSSAYFYTLAHKKGLHRLTSNPKPGFSNLKWLVDNRDGKTSVPLYEAIIKNINATHKCVEVPYVNPKIIPYKIAVHLHLFYIDLVDEFSNYFKMLPKGYHLYVTIVDSSQLKLVKEKFANSGPGLVEVIIVDNIGRDVAPLIFDLKSHLIEDNCYEIIGHFHSKKTISASDDLGAKWRAYILDNLIGDSQEIANSVLGIFNDEKVGLVFPEDKTYVDIGENKSFINDLCQKIGMNQVNETPIFPLGNMFWARTNAIKDLFYFDKTDILEQEPLPRDGSYMHAIERLTPALVEKNGYNYVTVYKSGTSW